MVLEIEDQLLSTLERTLSDMSRSATKEQDEARLAASIGVLALLVAAVTFALGSEPGAIMMCVMAALCGVLALEPYASYRTTATHISELEDRLLKEGIKITWSKGRVPEAELERG